jgi:ABC-type dipeptide/oligopeptide/nickel transport system permease subunit
MAGTANIETSVLVREGIRAQASRGYWSDAWRRLRRDRVSLAAMAVLAFLVLLAVGADFIAENVTRTSAYKIDLLNNYAAPSAANWFGTDENGRDYFARIISAGRVSLQIGAWVALFATLIGIPLGLMAAFFGGWVDDLINAVINTINSIPGLFVLILLATLFRPGVVGLALIVAVFGWTNNARQVRGVALSIRERDYVHAAEAMGAGNMRIILQHILPNVLSIVVVTATFDVAGGILAESGLSFVGLGILPPTASWGNMLSGSLSYVSKQPWLIVFPGLFIFATVLSVFLLGDGLRDALDPRLRQSK